jgi:hypothetical protein
MDNGNKRIIIFVGEKGKERKERNNFYGLNHFLLRQLSRCPTNCLFVVVADVVAVVVVVVLSVSTNKNKHDKRLF